MATRKMIDEFLALRNLALIRSTPRTKVAGFDIAKEFTKKGYTISLVYLEADNSGADSEFKKLQDLTEPVEGVIISVPSAQAEKALKEVVEAKIGRVWIQQGSESKAAIQLCQENGIEAVYGECIMMFAEPVKSVHAFHRWIKKLFGMLPK